jgi:hypothetical protein
MPRDTRSLETELEMVRRELELVKARLPHAVPIMHRKHIQVQRPGGYKTGLT